MLGNMLVFSNSSFLDLSTYDWKTAQLLNCLPDRHEDLNSIPTIQIKMQMYGCACSPSTGEVKTEGSLDFAGYLVGLIGELQVMRDPA